MNPLSVLSDPERYKEIYITRALIDLWPCISHHYPLTIERLSIMPSWWQPDIVAVNRVKQACLVIEVKGVPPANTKDESQQQLLKYVTQLHARYQGLTIWPVLIGPYGKDGALHYVHRKRHDIAVVDLQSLCYYLLSNAAKLMLVASEKAPPEVPGCIDVLFSD